MAKKEYVSSIAALGILARHNPRLVANMKVGDEYAVIMDNAVVVVGLREDDDTVTGTQYYVKELKSIQGEGLIRFKRTKAVKS